MEVLIGWKSFDVSGQWVLLEKSVIQPDVLSSPPRPPAGPADPAALGTSRCRMHREGLSKQLVKEY